MPKPENSLNIRTCHRHKNQSHTNNHQQGKTVKHKYPPSPQARSSMVWKNLTQSVNVKNVDISALVLRLATSLIKGGNVDIIYSIGHSNHETDHFINLLRKAEVDLILDVRSSPWSKRYPQFNREELPRALKPHGIGYEWFGLWYGARQTDESFYMPAGWLNYAWYTASHNFKEGISQMDRYLVMGKTPVLMCAEKDPFDCHRAIMVSRALSLQGYEIRHILADGSIQTQAQLDERVLDKYFPHREEMDIFGLIEGESDPAQVLAEAYLRRNEAIAWRLENPED